MAYNRIEIERREQMTDCDKCKEYDKEKNYCSVFCNVINDTLTDRAIEELEKIKDRLEVAMWYNRRDKEYCLELIGKRISELKGE